MQHLKQYFVPPQPLAEEKPEERTVAHVCNRLHTKDLNREWCWVNLLLQLFVRASNFGLHIYQFKIPRLVLGWLQFSVQNVPFETWAKTLMRLRERVKEDRGWMVKSYYRLNLVSENVFFTFHLM